MTDEYLNLRIGGVPEHFNLPWRMLIESGMLEDVGIAATWRDFYGGTGSMVRALNSGSIDVAMLLTEGAVAGIADGGGYKILSLYTTSPLVWGIHVPASSNIHAVDAIRGVRYAISRSGSGSHLMAYVQAKQYGWPVEQLEFLEVGNLDGARDALSAGRADVFLWEKFTTQPFVDSGEFRRVGDFVSPWPCFVMCASEAALAQHAAAIATSMQAALALAGVLAEDPQCAKLIAGRYGLKDQAVKDWLAITAWAQQPGIESDVIAPVYATLSETGLVGGDFSVEDFLASFASQQDAD